MKLLHLSDLHASREHWDELCASLDVVEKAADGVDLIAIAGDIWDGPVQNTERDVCDALCARIQRLANLAPVAMIYGTPSHDAPGSFEVFEKLKAEFPITILRPGKAYFLDADGISENQYPCNQAILFGVPEPSKKWLLANAGATGKDATDEAVRAAMRSLFLGLGGMRKEHANLPCVLLYHGQVSGAKTGTGYAAGSGIAVSRDDLASVGFDYGALGDIHLPQQIQGLPAYYPGKAYTGNWNEQGYVPGCNLVESSLHSGTIFTSVERLDFPHPSRRKIAMTSADPVPSNAEGLVWLEITATKEEAAGIDADEILSRILGHGALPGSRVTLNVLPTETVRAADIAKTASLRDEVRIWAENSSLTAPETALLKADELNREQIQATAGAHIRIDRLVLRGAKGTWKKSKKDEIDLDLASYGPGVVALVGPNGAGKTTLLENLHPWASMLTRDGTLKDHFRLADSFRDLYFTDDRTGWHYRAQINVRADIASGGAEYFLSIDKGVGFEPCPGINGRKEPYETAIGELFGSLELYLRTAFATQRPTKYAPDLSEATKGQRKALFCELAGIDYYDVLRGEAKGHGDVLDGEIRGYDATIQAAADVEGSIARLQEDRSAAGSRVTEAEALAVTIIEAGKLLAAERKAIAETVSGLEQKAARAAQVAADIKDLTQAVQDAKAEIEGYQAAAAGKGAAEEQLRKIEALESELAGLKREKDVIDEADRTAATEYQAARDRSIRLMEAARQTVDTRRGALGNVEKSLAVAEAMLAEPIVDTCPTCGQTLPTDRLKALQDAHKQGEAVVAGLKDEVIKAKDAASEAERALAAIIPPPPPEPKEYPGKARIAEIQGALEFLDRKDAEATLRAASEAAVRIEEAGKRQAERETRLAMLRAELDTIGDVTERLTTSRAELTAKDIELEAAREKLTAAREQAASAKATIEADDKAIAEAEKRIKARDEAAVKRSAAALELADWRLLERAFGADGIPALKLDALAPSIAAVANKILADAFGSRYQIEFRTTRMAGKGKDTHQVEDFEIYILDTETGDEQEIATLSGGESVWIKKALYSGFGIIRARNTGTQFLTVILDEADGALDPESRMMYLRMIEAEHAESGRFQTILVTHSTELQAMIERTINVAELGARDSEKVEAAA